MEHVVPVIVCAFINLVFFALSSVESSTTRESLSFDSVVCVSNLTEEAKAFIKTSGSLHMIGVAACMNCFKLDLGRSVSLLEPRRCFFHNFDTSDRISFSIKV